MPNDFENASSVRGPVFSTFAYTLLEEILANAANPARMNQELVQQLREVTGARLVVLTRRREPKGGHEPAAFEPQRRRSIAESPSMMAWADMTGDLDGPMLWENGNVPSCAYTLLEEDLPGPSMAVPLRVGKEQVGALLLFGLPDQHCLDQVMDALDMMSRVVALVLKNATLYEDQEATIANRTRELDRVAHEWQTTFDSTNDAIWILDKEQCVRRSNKASERFFNYSPEEIIGRHCWEIVHGTEQPIPECPLQRAKVSLRRESMELQRGDRWLEITADPILEAEGHYSGAVHIVSDITERRRLEEQLLQAQKMESIGRLAGGVAHDFNNMLNVILGYGEILLNQLHSGDPMRDDVKEIVAAGERSAALTRQLLAFSRRQTLQPEVLDLNAVVRNLEKMLRRLIGEDIDLELMLFRDLSPVMADPGQIEQVVMNLAVNGRDAMPDGGSLILETSNVDLDEVYTLRHAGAVPGRYVMLAMTDTGCGMDKEALSQIFEPFFTTKEKGKGTGLGLATVYGIVKQSGGQIWAYSEPGRGSTFKIYFPQAEGEPETKEESVEREDQRGEGERILVVEDEAPLRGLLEKTLSHLGYRVIITANGGEALLQVEEQGLKPDLVISDVVMPGMNGAVLAERLRKTRPDLKVLFMSGYTENSIVHNGRLDSGVPFLQKPFNIRDLADKVKELLQEGGE